MPLYQSLVNRLQTQHETIGVIIASINNERLLLQPAPGKWSITDNIAHLAKYQPVFIDRASLITTGGNPLFEPYRAENDPGFSEWQTWGIKKLMNRLHADRQLIYALITGLAGTQLTLTGIHKKFGQLTIIQWTEFFLLHEAHHIFTIFQIANNREL